MAFFSRNGRGQAPSQIPIPSVEPFKSLGMQALFHSLKPEKKYSVLDLGSGAGSTIEYLTQFSSRIRVADLFHSLTEHGLCRPDSQPVDGAAIAGTLSIPDTERFDIVLCWDLPNFFCREEFAALVKYLDGYCVPGTFFFAICSTLKEVPAIPLSYKVEGSELLLYSTGSTETRACPRFTPRELTQLLPHYGAHSSYILRNGMQEYLFVHR